MLFLLYHLVSDTVYKTEIVESTLKASLVNITEQHYAS